MEKSDRTEVLATIGARIRLRRRELNITQEALAEKAGLSKSFLSEVEGGSASASGLICLKIAEALDLSVEWILTGELPEPALVRSNDIQIPSFVATLAEDEGWSYAETVDIAAALQTVVARRTRGRHWEPDRDDLLALAAAVRRLRPDGQEKKGK